MNNEVNPVAGGSEVEWRLRLVRCGLEIVSDAGGPSGSVQAAIRTAAGIAAEPVAAVPIASPKAISELDREWHRYASQNSLYTPDGEFLILPPGAGGSKVGWVRVKDPVGHSLPSRVAAVAGSPEFLAISVDERHVCAAALEEDEYWVIVGDIA